MKDDFQPLVIIAGPSGAGKTAGVPIIVSLSDCIARVVTSTTRAMRRGEKNGIDYNFYSDAEFDRKLLLDHFFESDQPYEGKARYGVERAVVESIWGEEKIPLLAITLPGVAAFKEEFPSACTIFMHPGSISELERRLRNDPNRANMKEEELRRRLRQAEDEMADWTDYCDHLVKNPDGGLEIMARDVISIIERHYPECAPL